MDEFTDPYSLPHSSDDERVSSIFYTLLPKLVRSRLRRLPSIRRGLHQYSRSYSSQDSRRSSSGLSDLRTPPPEYRSRASLSEPVSDSEFTGEELLGRRGSCSEHPAIRNGSGIKWKFANQGLSLLNLAAQEDSIVSDSGRNSSLSRRLYVHALTYLVRGLPCNLSPEEKISIFSSLPPEVRDISQNLGTKNLVRRRSTRLVREDGELEEEPSLLHRALAALVVRMFVVFQLLLPYLRVWFAAAYRYERQHRISERVLCSSVDTMQIVMKSGVRFGNAVCQMNDGKVGQSISNLTVWWVKGVTGGIHQGVGEGLVILGVDNPNVVGKQRLEKTNAEDVNCANLSF